MRNLHAGPWARAGQVLAVIALLMSVVGCAMTGSRFDSSGLALFVPGVTSREQADQYLHGPAYQSYRQLDGSQTAVWLYRRTLATDAIYINQELWLQFDDQGRFSRVVKRDNIPTIYKEQAAPRPSGSITVESPDSDMITIHPVTR